MPSKAHLDLQHRAVSWLSARATARGVRAGFEIRVGPNYIADVAALLSFQFRHAKAYGLLEHRTVYSQTVICACEPCCIFEAKATRADFLATFGPKAVEHRNRRVPVGDLHWTVVKRGIAEPKELPAFWGMLVQSGQGLRELRQPSPSHASDSFRLALAYELLWYGADARPRKATRALESKAARGNG